MNEQEIKEEAIAFAKASKKRLAEKYTDVLVYSTDKIATSIFMAGSPGAGKTEAAQRFVEKIESQSDKKILRIDIDDIRNIFEKYTGGNAYVFQHPATIIADAIHDLALNKSVNFIFDGTFSHYDIAVKNIARSLKRNRYVNIIYVYQRPELAWDFTQKREEVEGRRVTKEKFIDQFINSREVVERIKKEYKEKVKLDIIIKNIDNTDFEYYLNQKDIKSVIKKKYSVQDLLDIVQ